MASTSKTGQLYRCVCSECKRRNGEQGVMVSYATLNRHKNKDLQAAAAAAIARFQTPAAARQSAIPGYTQARQLHQASKSATSDAASSSRHSHVHNLSSHAAHAPVPAPEKYDQGSLVEDVGNMSLDIDVGPPNAEEEEDNSDDEMLSELESVSSHNSTSQPTIPTSRLESSRADETPSSPPTTFVPVIEDLKPSLEYIETLRNAKLDNKIEPIPSEVVEQIRNPPTHELLLDDPDHRLSIDLFLATTNASEATYNSTRAAILRRYPDSGVLSFFQVKKLLVDLTGVTSVSRDMCINSCIGYTGPYADRTSCPMCREPRFDTQMRDNRVVWQSPRKQFTTIPLGLQLQGMWRSKHEAQLMQYSDHYTQKIIKELHDFHGIRQSPYQDFFDGSDYLAAVQSGKVNPKQDVILLLSLDGAKLYHNKDSDCWMYIWIILNREPGLRYKKRYVLPGGFIPGPNKPKNLDTFLFPRLHHLAALQKEGLRVWDAIENRLFVSYPFLALAAADGPGMACLNGFVGHQGKMHCRLHCPLPGRRKATQYYPASLQPINYAIEGSNHSDINLWSLLQNFNSKEAAHRYKNSLSVVLSSTTSIEYKSNRLETGIVKPTILSGLPQSRILGIPACFVLDIMHLPALNLPDLFIPLWQGKFQCDRNDDKSTWDWVVLTGDTWKNHGKMVADTKPYIPGSFDRPPRNPAEKMSSGYKAWEFLLYFFGLGPCLFFDVLPRVYWKHYCRGVRGFRLLLQEEIYPSELAEAHDSLIKFCEDFESLYYQRLPERIHFVRPSIHTPIHIASETLRIGPPIIYSQWAMERTIGNLGEEIRLHSDPFANLAQRGLYRCQVNSLKALVPDIELPPTKPRGGQDLGDDYTLLPAVDNAPRAVEEKESDAIKKYLMAHGEMVEMDSDMAIVRWARLQLPNGQIVRTKWKESLKQTDRLRIARNVKITNNGVVQIGEVLYFALLAMKRAGTNKAIAVISHYGDPNKDLLRDSYGTYDTRQHMRDAGIDVIDVKRIDSVVMMAPDQVYAKRIQDGTENDRWYLMEKPGIKLGARIGGEEEEE